MLQKIIHFSIYLIALSLPLYLIRFRIGWIPTNLLELMICGLFIVWLVSRIRTNQVRLGKATFFLPVFLIFLGVTLATLFSVDIITSAGIWKSWFIVPLIFFLVVVSSIKIKEQVKNILIALILSGTGVALIAFFYWLNNNLTYDGRLRAFYLSPNYLAMYLSPILILSFYLYFCIKRRFFKILLFIINCLLFTIIYLTYSYGAWLSLLVAFVFLLIILIRRPQYDNRRLIFYLSSFIFLLIILAFFWQMPSQKFQSFFDFSYSPWQSRVIIWQSAAEIIKDHSLVGIGPGLFQKYYLDEQAKFLPYIEWAVPQPHNLFLAFWLQTGLLGLIGFVWLLIIFFKSGINLIQNSKFKIQNCIFMAAMVCILIHGLVDTTYWKNDLAVIFWLLIALSYKANRLSD